MRFLKVGVLGAMLVMPGVALAAVRIEPPAVTQPSASPAAPSVRLIDDQNDPGPFPAIGHAFHDVGHSVTSGAKHVGHAVARPVKHFGHSVAAGWHSFKRNLNDER
jgi:hypothetical protein